MGWKYHEFVFAIVCIILHCCGITGEHQRLHKVSVVVKVNSEAQPEALWRSGTESPRIMESLDYKL